VGLIRIASGRFSPLRGALRASKTHAFCRTHEGLQTLAGFQDQCIQPLCHLSRVVTVMRRRILLAASNGFNQTLWKYEIAMNFGGCR